VFKKQALLGLAIIAVFGFSLSAHHLTEKSIAERTKSQLKVYKEGDEIPEVAPVVVQSSSGGTRSAEEIYTTKCAMCHDAGIAGAPKMGDVAAWSERIKQGQDMLVSHAIDGFQGAAGVMPPKGGCVDCSDQEITDAVIYMVEKSQ
jgi:cytochrome c5